jgi:hypothetical protein
LPLLPFSGIGIKEEQAQLRQFAHNDLSTRFDVARFSGQNSKPLREIFSFVCWFGCLMS